MFMGNTLREWDRTYDLNYQQRKVAASLQELQKRRTAMFNANLAQEHLEGAPETDSEGDDEVSGSDTNGTRYGSDSGSSDEGSFDVEPEAPPLVTAGSKKRKTGGNY
jgi:hypothetical protein